MNKIFNFKSKLLEKTQIALTDFKLIYEVPLDLTFKPGQFVTIRFSQAHNRAYSIVDIVDGKMELLVDIKPGGIASKFFEKTVVGEEVQMLAPFGIYGIKSDLPSKVFICTGTGVAPFIPMVKSLDLSKSSVYILFGTQTNANDIGYAYFKDMVGQNLKYIQCVTREDPKKPYAVKGRTTEILPNLFSKGEIDPVNTEFYICGSSDMIANVVEILKAKGATKIYYEKYG